MGDVKRQHYYKLSQSNNGLKWSNSFDNMNEYGSLFLIQILLLFGATWLKILMHLVS
jgi:hypothetical protein